MRFPPGLTAWKVMSKNRSLHIYTIDLMDEGQLNVFIKVYQPDRPRDFYERLHMTAFDLFSLLEEKGVSDPDIKKIMEEIKQT